MSVVKAQKNVGIQDPKTCKSLRFYFREYCNCSSIHGFKYFGEKRTYFERIWWFVVFSIVVGGCSYTIFQVYAKWKSSPVIVSFDTEETKIHDIPFPAVTICPEIKTQKLVYNHTDIYLKIKRMENVTKTEEIQASYMNMICDNIIGLKSNDNSSRLLSEDFYDFLDNVTRKTIIKSCFWMGRKCNDLFFPIITDEGVCFTFNMFDRRDIFSDNVIHYQNYGISPDRRNLTWTMDKGYDSDVDLIDTYPKRAQYPGVKNALDVTLAAYREDMDPFCKDSIQGFKVMLHTPMRFPRAANSYLRVPLDQAVLGTIEPQKISTSEGVRMYTPKKRNCFFPLEKNLKYFKIYTQLNCNFECLTNLTLSFCQCVNFYMPRENGTAICGPKKRECMLAVERFLQARDILHSIQEVMKNKTRSQIYTSKFHSILEAPNCSCLPICNDLTYSMDISQSRWDYQSKYVALNQKNFNKKMRMSRLSIYFRTSQFVTSIRHELYGIPDFVANFGGLLGLFTGFSALSIMEIVYFLTIRMFCNIRLYGRWYGPEALR
ncbi:hypothetical protein ABEB36_014663 [Hypothenemus hampei]|uniref:Uncharacterized protein n=1 Tax=Hypothenemus hampei TaxID=57062 RepID=A0ABD1E2G5_HYPHA